MKEEPCFISYILSNLGLMKIWLDFTWLLIQFHWNVHSPELIADLFQVSDSITIQWALLLVMKLLSNECLSILFACSCF